MSSLIKFNQNAIIFSRDVIYLFEDEYYSDYGVMYTINLMADLYSDVTIVARIKPVNELDTTYLYKWHSQIKFKNCITASGIFGKILSFTRTFSIAILHGSKFDVIITRMFSFESLGASIAASFFFRKKWILSIHGEFSQSIKLLWEKKIGFLSTFIAPFFQVLNLYLVKSTNILLTSGHQIPKTFGIKKYHSFMDSGIVDIIDSKDLILKTKFDTIKLLYVGEMSERKGLKILFDSISLIDKNVVLTLVGKKNDFLNDLLTHYPEFKGNIIIKGFIPYGEKLFEEISSHDLLVLPSLGSEGWSRVITEANSVGVPAIVSDVNGLTQAVAEFSSGLCFQLGDAISLSNSINWISNNCNSYNVLRYNSLERANKYTFHNEKERLYKFIQICQNKL
jgi:glycosyltransferase involved in cell wall biosynthesis